MTHHPRPPARTDDELRWYQRRSLLQGAALWAACGAGTGALAQQPRSSIVELRGDVYRNGQRIGTDATLAAGDQISTGPGSMVVFTVADTALMVRQNTQLALEGDTPTAVKVLRLLSGAAASVWGRGADRKIVLPTATAGIRGTGVYAEVMADEDHRGYLCNCYGTVDITAGTERRTSVASYHQAFWAERTPRNGTLLSPAGAVNHTDEELEFLASLIGQRTAWQIAGRKGSKDGGGALAPAYSPNPPGYRD